MPRRSGNTELVPLHVDRKRGEPLHRQVYRDLVQLILSGRLRSAARVPSSRMLAEELGVARNTVLLALEQLHSEGYVETRHGSGTYVVHDLPEMRPIEPRRRAAARHRPPALSRRSRPLATRADPLDRQRGLLSPGEPDCAGFPFDLWARLLAASWRAPERRLLLGEEAAGLSTLRAAVADYLAAARGVRATAEQIVIVAGIRQALTVAARILLDPGDAIWLEDPGFPGLRPALSAAGARLVPVDVDGEGLRIPANGEPPRLICVTPSHQYPLGMTMSVARRLALLDHARTVNAWVFEDDYDSEWRYAGRPLAAMQGLDQDGRVLYAGTFSKILFPSIRLGYVVLPTDLIEPFLAARRILDDQPGVFAQPALAEFILGGHLATHLRRQRRRYKARQELLLRAARQHLRGLLDVAPDAGGMHLIGYLHRDLAARMDDREASRRAVAVGLTTPPLSSQR